MLADSAVDIHAARLMTYHAAEKIDRGERASSEAGMAKLFATEQPAAWWIARCRCSAGSAR